MLRCLGAELTYRTLREQQQVVRRILPAGTVRIFGNRGPQLEGPRPVTIRIVGCSTEVRTADGRAALAVLTAATEILRLAGIGRATAPSPGVVITRSSASVTVKAGLIGDPIEPFRLGKPKLKGSAAGGCLRRQQMEL